MILAQLTETGGTIDTLIKGGVTGILALVVLGFIKRTLITRGELDRVGEGYEARIKQLIESYESRIEILEERREKWEKLAWELLTTNRQLGGAAERATLIAEKDAKPRTDP